MSEKRRAPSEIAITPTPHCPRRSPVYRQRGTRFRIAHAAEDARADVDDASVIFDPAPADAVGADVSPQSSHAIPPSSFSLQASMQLSVSRHLTIGRFCRQ